MDSSADRFFHGGHKYCHNGDKPFASSLSAASSGSKNAMMASFARFPKKGCYAGKKRRGSVGPCLGGSNGLVLLTRRSSTPRAKDQNFQTVGGTAYLYFTQFHYSNCQQTLDHDLVRVPIRIAAP
jgi:hypothetical protein